MKNIYMATIYNLRTIYNTPQFINVSDPRRKQ